MHRRSFIRSVIGAALAPAGFAHAGERKLGTLQQPADHWKAVVSAEAFDVLFDEDTEAPHSSPLYREHRDGTYVCAACLQPLFDASKKYESGTGWPSFWQPLPDAIATKSDRKLFVQRTEYHCARCGGHQGHVFDDGPKPTGLRYCNNGLALRFVPRTEKLPEQRS